MRNPVDMPVGVDIQGNLIAPDLTAEILAGEARGQSPEDFGLDRGDKLADEIAIAWGDAKAYWSAFQRAVSRLPEDDPATSATREQWAVPLMMSLGYKPVYTAKAEVVEGQTYAISHRAERGENRPPVHIIGCRLRLEQRPPSGTPRLSAHALVQEYLNRTEHLWSVVTNGLRWRLLRDSTLMTRLTYVEFDLEQILNGENFAEFGLFYRLFHRSRLPQGMEDADDCLLEVYHQASVQQGGRVRDRLRDGVESALRTLGSGFLQHPSNQALRDKFPSFTASRPSSPSSFSPGEKGNQSNLPSLSGRGVGGEGLTDTAYYRLLLMLIYRLLFLMVAESRSLLLSADDPEQARIYQDYYSIERLRTLAERPSWRREGFQDLWQGLRVTFQLFDENWRGQMLGLTPLDGDLFGSHTLAELDGCAIDNHDLTLALRQLSLYEQKGQRRRVNYGALDVEELGSVYESLLDFHPQVVQRQGNWEFQLVTGSDRKTTGSYYTPPELVGQLIKSALEPVIEERLRNLNRQQAQSQALLSLKICDPACGSGHFLLAAARRIGKELAQVRTGEAQPGPEPLRVAIRDVIQHCIYGVDLNPLAVDLCKVALWLEGLCRGLSLNFLDHRIKCGNSLVGVLDLDCLKEGIPDNAFKPVTGDDKKLASQFKKRNKQERESSAAGQFELVFENFERDRETYAKAWREVEGMKDDDPAAVRLKQAKYERSRHLMSWLRDRSACNLWTAAFFMPLTEQNLQLLPTSALVKNLLQGNSRLDQVVDAADRLAEEKRFFHWPLEFPEVFEQGGFDCMLGNPPWEKIQVEEKPFFAVKVPEVSKATGSKRKKMIESLRQESPETYRQFEDYRKEVESIDKFIKLSLRFPLTGNGKLNTYSIFSELFLNGISLCGASGLIVPLGIATDDGNKQFFSHLIEDERLMSLWGFENEEFMFPEVHHAFKFVLMSISGKAAMKNKGVSFAFYCRKSGDISEKLRQYEMLSPEIILVNPNTKTSPIFRTRVDADLTKKIYAYTSVIRDNSKDSNPWKISIHRMLNQTDDSELFITKKDLSSRGYSSSMNSLVCKEKTFLPVYEAKMIHQFDHRFGTYKNQSKAQENQGKLPELDDDQHKQVNLFSIPRYWVESDFLSKFISHHTKKRWLLAFRDITSSGVFRTAIAAFIPRVFASETCKIVYFDESVKTALVLCFLACINSLVFDYCARQKVSGNHLSTFIFEQLPVIPPNSYSRADIDFIAPRVLELTYTAWDLQPFAQDMGYDGEPFIWNPERRALLRADLDAYYAHLYGLSRDELRYILDPADLYGPDFPSETFRVLKNNELKQFGEYRTQRLVLAAWDKLGF
ncbi:N-6 DNA methylase [Romeria aff. gracilis LEGE 07310]|uniref:site-specific DNA-methyltransferase (adenine-specific) n=1 Tax=Vasconcelosia minhoensis LEGE 07310 TaxID=915328 RepID=A0A8J7DRF5_9CYAN|nr:N-6 DNA methylase [Romeria gracilis]MBE9078409.1 N-6 DNA methylase [Romeria aff. gracilis LEGE 07310]